MEYTAIKIELKDNKKILMIALYAKKGKQTEFIKELENIFIKLKINNSANYYVIVGNFNAKHVDWNNISNNE